jgi:hypothetical protein
LLRDTFAWEYANSSRTLMSPESSDVPQPAQKHKDDHGDSNTCPPLERQPIGVGPTTQGTDRRSIGQGHMVWDRHQSIWINNSPQFSAPVEMSANSRTHILDRMIPADRECVVDALPCLDPEASDDNGVGLINPPLLDALDLEGEVDGSIVISESGIDVSPFGSDFIGENLSC